MYEKSAYPWLSIACPFALFIIESNYTLNPFGFGCSIAKFYY